VFLKAPRESEEGVPLKMLAVTLLLLLVALLKEPRGLSGRPTTHRYCNTKWRPMQGSELLMGWEREVV